MLTKNHIKLINSLQLKKHREEHGLFVAEGVKIVNELLNSNIRVKTIFIADDPSGQIPLRGKQKPEIIEVSEAELKKISSLSTPNRILAVAETPKYDIKKEDLVSQLSIVLDDIQDPGNVGTIIRIADWFGIKNIICSENSADAFNPKVVQATMGSIARVKIHYANLLGFLEGWKSEAGSGKLKVYGTLLKGKNIYKENLSDKGFIILGNESKGISDKLFPHITDKIVIPSFAGNTGAESLNVAVAAAIICSEFKRCRS